MFGRMGSGRLALRLRTNDVRTGESPAYPDVRPLDLPLAPPAAWAAALEAAAGMPRWRIVDADPAGGTLRAEATTALLRFVDDVWIEVAPRAGGSRIAVRSASRIGVTDLGANARRIRAYLTRLAGIASG